MDSMKLMEANWLEGDSATRSDEQRQPVFRNPPLYKLIKCEEPVDLSKLCKKITYIHRNGKSCIKIKLFVFTALEKAHL